VTTAATWAARSTSALTASIRICWRLSRYVLASRSTRGEKDARVLRFVLEWCENGAPVRAYLPAT
jgi:hypothetical protein